MASASGCTVSRWPRGDKRISPSWEKWAAPTPRWFAGAAVAACSGRNAEGFETTCLPHLPDTAGGGLYRHRPPCLQPRPTVQHKHSGQQNQIAQIAPCHAMPASKDHNTVDTGRPPPARRRRFSGGAAPSSSRPCPCPCPIAPETHDPWSAEGLVKRKEKGRNQECVGCDGMERRYRCCCCITEFLHSPRCHHQGGAACYNAHGL